jgi:hypothetical protein
MEAVDAAVLDCIAKARYIVGPQVGELEKKMAHLM